MSNPPRIMVVDDEPAFLHYMRAILEEESYQVETASSGWEALRHLQTDLPPDLVLLDLLMPELDGLETLERMRHVRPGVKVIIVSCVNNSREVVQAVRLGAQDFLTKPILRAELESVLGHYLSGIRDIDESRRPSSSEMLENISDDLVFVAASPAMRRIHAQVKQLANFDVPVLLLGESGSGKEVIARLIHKLSSRSQRPFLKVNCAALPADLLESELFGYEPGAFTGATRAKPGQFELCDTGTILLDEIGEMPPSLQAKLLHVLQDQEFSRLCGRTVVKVDVRILAATNVNIDEALATRKLREDLYYRLDTFALWVPPLRDRREEIPLLLRHFMARFAARYAKAPLSFSPRLLEACVRYPWPGNLRELENFVRRYLIRGDEGEMLEELKSGRVVTDVRPPTERLLGPGDACPSDLKEFVRNLKDGAEAEAITRALEQTGGKHKQAARLLNISYRALIYKIRQYGLK